MGYVDFLNLVLYLRPYLFLYLDLLVVGVHHDHGLICDHARGPYRRRGHLDDPYPFYHRPLVYPFPSYRHLLVDPFYRPSPYLFWAKANAFLDLLVVIQNLALSL